MSRGRVVVLDVDGTLIDSNDAHARSWVDAGAELGHEVDFQQVRRLIGMGGDKVSPQVTGLQEDSEEGKRFAERRGAIFRERYLPALRAFPGARELLERFRADGYLLAVATSASAKDMGPILEQAGLDDLIDVRTSSGDAEASKPDPDIVLAALERSGMRAEDAIMLGDTPYDVEASRRAGVPCVALRSGGWGDAELADAVAIYQDARELLERYDASPFAP